MLVRGVDEFNYFDKDPVPLIEFGENELKIRERFFHKEKQSLDFSSKRKLNDENMVRKKAKL